MKSGDDQLAVLHRLRSEGQITEAEYEHLSGGLGPGDADEELTEEPEAPGDDGNTTTEEEGLGPSALIPTPALRQDVSVNHVGTLVVAAIGLIVISSLDMLSWFLTIAAILLLATTLIEGWRNVTIVGALIVATLMLIGFSISPADGVPGGQTVPATPPPADPAPAIPGSLGLYMDEVTETWNTVDGAPRITRGLTRHNESGEYDTFIYRFGEWGRLAGAFDPDNDAVYALLAAGWLSEDATSQFYLRLCFMVAPYSQECVDSYLEHGLAGGTLGDLTELPHEAEWVSEGHTWRLEITENVLTIRVFGADAA